MSLLDTVIHWLHLMGAVIWVGGMIFFRWMLTPVTRQELPTRLRRVLFGKIGKRCYMVGWTALAVSIATGIYKVSVIGAFGSNYGMLLLAKLSLIFLMLILSYLHDFVWGPRLRALADTMDPDEYRRAARKISFWARVNVAAAVSVVFLGASLRMNPF